jgi:hypothetical protein
MARDSSTQAQESLLSELSERVSGTKGTMEFAEWQTILMGLVVLYSRGNSELQKSVVQIVDCLGFLNGKKKVVDALMMPVEQPLESSKACLLKEFKTLTEGPTHKELGDGLPGFWSL